MRVVRLVTAAFPGVDAEARLIGGWGAAQLQSRQDLLPLAVPVGQWIRITVTYDYRELTIAVNGRTFSLPCQERAFFNPATFGGPNHSSPGQGIGADTQYFHGKLCRLRIAHRAENE